jgi:hypothetical protein
VVIGAIGNQFSVLGCQFSVTKHLAIRTWHLPRGVRAGISKDLSRLNANC